MKKTLTSLFAALIILTPAFLSAQVFNAPYSNDFETGSPGWVAMSDSNSQWQLGMPAFGATSSTHSGDNSWDVSLQSAYLNSSNCYLRTPAFNFSNLSSLEISFWQNRNCEMNWDGMTLQYTTDTLQPWSVLGTMNPSGSVNWYNTAALYSNNLPGWSGLSTGWVQSSIVIPNMFGANDVWFRFGFTSDASVVLDGISIDDFSIEETEMNTITGTVYLDVNQNYVYDAGDLPYSGIPINSNNGTISEIQSSDNNGIYYFISDSGSTYVITPDAPLYSVLTPSNYSITINGSNQVSSANDFLITFLPDVLDVGLNLSQSGVRPAMHTSSYIHYYNQGTMPASGTITLEYDQAFTFLNASQNALPIATNTLEFTYSNLLPGQSANIIAEFLVNTNLPLGTQTHVSAIIYPLFGDSLVTNNYDSAMQVAVNSCDPNDKQVIPEGDLPILSVAAGLDLSYTIRFQNTGTAPAFHVNIFDQLSENVDLSTFEITGSSHPITAWSIGTNRLLNFEFANINLPDSFANEPQSHGFIRYKIRPLTSLAVGQSIDNQAAIYFDNNAPVMTNITSSVVVDPTGVHEVNPNATSLFVFPNPTAGNFYLKTEAGQNDYKIINSVGQEVSTGLISNPGELQEISLDKVPAGFYILIVNGTKSSRHVNIVVE